MKEVVAVHTLLQNDSTNCALILAQVVAVRTSLQIDRGGGSWQLTADLISNKITFVSLFSGRYLDGFDLLAEKLLKKYFAILSSIE